MIRIELPVAPEKIRELSAGDEVTISGVMITGRDTAHKYLVETNGDDVRDLLKDGMIYHCGPVVKQEGGRYSFVAAGPTTSIREEPYEAEVIEKYGVRGVIGKGGMGPRTLEACGKFGCVYLSAVGGLATLLARSVVEVMDVHKLDEWGAPEAMWVIRVEDFPAIVTMDAHGKSIHDEIAALSKANYDRLISGE